MTPGEIIQYCQQNNASLSVKGIDRLLCKGPKEVVTQELVENLKTYKWELINILAVMAVFDGTIGEAPAGLHYKKLSKHVNGYCIPFEEAYQQCRKGKTIH